MSEEKLRVFTTRPVYVRASPSSHHTRPLPKRTEVPSQGTLSWFNPNRNTKYRFIVKLLTY